MCSFHVSSAIFLFFFFPPLFLSSFSLLLFFSCSRITFIPRREIDRYIWVFFCERRASRWFSDSRNRFDQRSLACVTQLLLETRAGRYRSLIARRYICIQRSRESRPRVCVIFFTSHRVSCDRRDFFLYRVVYVRDFCREQASENYKIIKRSDKRAHEYLGFELDTSERYGTRSRRTR